MQPKILTHFAKVDPVLHQVWQQLEQAGQGEIVVKGRPTDELFVDICEAIVGQQLSDKAARTIWNRFVALFPEQKVTPQAVLDLADDHIRATGPSWSKIKYLKNFAEAVNSGQLPLASFPELADEEIIRQLTQVKGIGRWTAEMFLMFGLGRADVFSTGDLGLRKAIERWYQLASSTPEELLHISASWAPYRTYAARILWKSLVLPAFKD